DNFRFVNYCSGKVQATLHTAAVVLNRLFGTIGKPHEIENGSDALGQIGAAQTLCAAPVGEVVGGGEVVVERQFLGGDAEGGASLGAFADDVETVDGNLAGSGL